MLVPKGGKQSLGIASAVVEAEIVRLKAFIVSTTALRPINSSEKAALYREALYKLYPELEKKWCKQFVGGKYVNPDLTKREDDGADRPPEVL